jgi:signal transduction histidine kinase
MSRLTWPYILLLNLVLCTVIALVLWLVVPAIGRYGYWKVFVHSQSIGNCICLLTIISLNLVGETRFDQPWIRSLVVTIATLAGIFLGMHIAHWLLGIPDSPLDFIAGREELTTTLVTAIIASGGFNWYLSNRERVVRLQLTASEERRRAENTRHALLRAQVQPHMLFNTLANLRALIGTDTDKAVNMLDRLDSFLRATLRASRGNTCQLADEFSLLEDYLELMKVRMGDRLHYELDLPEACRNIEVPALVLQPLVENAIKHGIETALKGGEIHVRARLEDQTLQLTVTDTGVGIDQTAIRDTNTAMNTSQANGFGLSNLRDRLAHGYGPAATLNISSRDNSGQTGTEVTIQLPLPSNAATIPAPMTQAAS